MTDRDMPAIVHLVDDDPSVRRALKRLLAAAGHACETWESAEAFLARPVGAAAGCVIIDLQLPGANGLDLQARLAESDELLPLIFLTGRGDIGTSVRAMKGGAVDFLTKPVEPEALLAAIATALDRCREARAARAAEASATSTAGSPARRGPYSTGTLRPVTRPTEPITCFTEKPPPLPRLKARLSPPFSRYCNASRWASARSITCT